MLDVIEVRTPNGVLFIDDEPDDMEDIETYLRDNNIPWSKPETLDAAAELMRTSPDKAPLLVLDLQFPLMPRDGLDFLRRLRTGGLPIRANSPTIVFTNAGDPATVEEVTRLGATFLEKSDLGGLHQHIRSALRSPVWPARLFPAMVENVVDGVATLVIQWKEQTIAQEVDVGFVPRSARIGGASFMVMEEIIGDVPGHLEYRQRAFDFPERAGDQERARRMQLISIARDLIK